MNALTRMFHHAPRLLTAEQVVALQRPEVAGRIVGQRRSRKDHDFWYVFLDDFLLPEFVVNPVARTVEDVLNGEPPCVCLARAEEHALHPEAA